MPWTSPKASEATEACVRPATMPRTAASREVNREAFEANP